MWVSWICLFILSYPQTDFTIFTVDGPKTFHIGLNVWVFTFLMFLIGMAWAFGKASVFKYISDEYPDNIGVISTGRPHRYPLELFHADVRRDLGIADLDVFHGGASRRSYRAACYRFQTQRLMIK
jgi:hypothetical protein